MGWEKREGTARQYYVMKTRFGDRVYSHYVGRGETAGLISQLQTLYQQRDEEKRRQEAREYQRPEWEQRLDAYCEDVRALFRQEMQSAGWYLHRWQWRRGRGNMGRPKAQPATEPLIMRAQKDEAASLEILEQWKSRETLEKNLALVYQTFFGYAERRATANPLLRTAIQHKTDDLRRELTQEGDTALEEMLIERVIVCYHALNDAEGTFQKINQEGGHTLTKIEHYDKSVERAHRRYLTAARELGIARRLRMPKRVPQEGGGPPPLRLLEGAKETPMLPRKSA